MKGNFLFKSITYLSLFLLVFSLVINIVFFVKYTNLQKAYSQKERSLISKIKEDKSKEEDLWLCYRDKAKILKNEFKPIDSLNIYAKSVLFADKNAEVTDLIYRGQLIKKYQIKVKETSGRQTPIYVVVWDYNVNFQKENRLDMIMDVYFDNWGNKYLFEQGDNVQIYQSKQKMKFVRNYGRLSFFLYLTSDHGVLLQIKYGESSNYQEGLFYFGEDDNRYNLEKTTAELEPIADLINF